MINEVHADSPAAKAGLRAGDIIVEADGKEIKSDGDLMRAINAKKDGDVTLTIVRDRNRQTITVTPEEMKNGLHTFEVPDAPNVPNAPQHFQFSMPPMPMTEFKFPGRVL